MAGDELDDGLEYDVNFSDSEAVTIENGSRVVSQSDENPSGGEVSVDEESHKENPRKRTKNPKLQEKKKIKMDMDVQRRKQLSTESSADVIADYVNDVIRRKNSELSALELSELYLKKTDFRSSAEFDMPRTLDNLSKFINGRFGNMLPSSTPGKKNTKNKKNKKGKEKVDTGNENGKAPQDERKFIAIMSMSAIRACDVHRALREIPGSSLKLINKNKLHVDLKLVQSTWSRVLCCTPGRLAKVLNAEESSLSKDEIKIVLLDNSYLDQKLQNIWHIPETTQVLKDLAESGAKIYLY
ncbi:hypothetical protein ACI3L0_002986 [Candidozyma auris]|uniref:Protein CMS1 n=1 Tax=Candidozyma auris TaxID=498019 RepID=A0A2H0ZXW4_CANAR|nr:hypothetical_protein [[Candida] auris]PIS55497.1 hypothetical protein B9J08_001597 [[Candida] auris]PSK80041.1 hypothetical protein CJJ07_000106 [[Candida] auris]QEO19294.1 hypothetical_protein [[Candida] auris]GBL50725.1 hypothetical protein CAJCM15448_29990 [[Candida] auris]